MPNNKLLWLKRILAVKVLLSLYYFQCQFKVSTPESAQFFHYNWNFKPHQPFMSRTHWKDRVCNNGGWF